MEVTLRTLRAAREMDPADWNACANPPGQSFNPFLDHAFYVAAEESGSASAENGWMPFHLVAESGDGQILGVMPLYVKSHSYGEYVFDHAWADAFRRAGGRYYPKLLSAVPFTPATGPRIWARPGPAALAIRQTLAEGAAKLASQLGVPSLHVTFAPEDEAPVYLEAGYLERHDRQFHWVNEGFKDFGAFLETLASRKRKQIRRERREAQESGLIIERLTGDDLREEHWDAFYRFYLDTGSRKWGSPYLNRDFFRRLGDTMAPHILLVMARQDQTWVAGALNLIGSDTLFGRNWGAIVDLPFLHFECCYYQAIDFAIERGLARVEAGAQGAHKLARGYRPAITRSFHFIGDAGFKRAVARYLEEERQAVAAEANALEGHLPFRRGNSSADIGRVQEGDEDGSGAWQERE